MWTGTGNSPPLRKILSTMVEPKGDGIIVVDSISMENTSAVPTRVMMSMGCSPATDADPPGSTDWITTSELGPAMFGICEASMPSTGTSTGGVTVIGGTLQPTAKFVYIGVVGGAAGTVNIGPIGIDDCARITDSAKAGETDDVATIGGGGGGRHGRRSTMNAMRPSIQQTSVNQKSCANLQVPPLHFKRNSVPW